MKYHLLILPLIIMSLSGCQMKDAQSQITIEAENAALEMNTLNQMEAPIYAPQTYQEARKTYESGISHLENGAVWKAKKALDAFRPLVSKAKAITIQSKEIAARKLIIQQE